MVTASMCASVDAVFRYLEELSQRYRRQMDDMYVSLNKTITKLANTSKSAERRVSGLVYTTFCRVFKVIFIVDS